MLFLSTYINKIDKKGRVSVPSSFRTQLAEQSFNGIVAYPSFINPCVESCGIDRIQKLSERIETLDPFSEEHDVFSTSILSGARELAFDGEGRVMLTEELIASAQLCETAMFVGKGNTFEIWEPESFKVHAERARQIAREKRLSLRSESNSGGQK
jgi:MraZ protein